VELVATTVLLISTSKHLSQTTTSAHLRQKSAKLGRNLRQMLAPVDHHLEWDFTPLRMLEEELTI